MNMLVHEQSLQQLKLQTQYQPQFPFQTQLHLQLQSTAPSSPSSRSRSQSSSQQSSQSSHVSVTHTAFPQPSLLSQAQAPQSSPRSSLSSSSSSSTSTSTSSSSSAASQSSQPPLLLSAALSLSSLSLSSSSSSSSSSMSSTTQSQPQPQPQPRNQLLPPLPRQPLPPSSRTPHRLRHQANSTSNVNIISTIIDPSMTELISSVSTMLHCQMMRDLDADDKKKTMFPFLCEETYTGKVVKEIPAVKNIYTFLKQVFEIGQFNAECCVISLVYINRLIGVTGVPLTQSNWKPVLISALVVAQKVWDDTPLINADFSVLYPVLTVKEVNFLERKFLNLLQFKLMVSSSLYAQYYFELQSISEENTQRGNSLRALTRAQLKRIELRSNLSELYLRDKHRYSKRSVTMEDIHPRASVVVLS